MFELLLGYRPFEKRVSDEIILLLEQSLVPSDAEDGDNDNYEEEKYLFTKPISKPHSPDLSSVRVLNDSPILDNQRPGTPRYDDGMGLDRIESGGELEEEEGVPRLDESILSSPERRRSNESIRKRNSIDFLLNLGKTPSNSPTKIESTTTFLYNIEDSGVVFSPTSSPISPSAEGMISRLLTINPSTRWVIPYN